MISRYNQFPLEFYRETPFNGKIYFQQKENLYLGSSRIKRFRRIAEKSSRRIIDYIFQRIKNEAEALARERASRLGVPFRFLLTSPDEQVQEFERAEQRIIGLIAKGKFRSSLPNLPVNDVIGLKVVCENRKLNMLLELIDKHENMSMHEYQVHNGNYNAVNMAIEYTLDKEILLETPLTDRAISVFKTWGMNSDDLKGDYKKFIEDGEDTIIFEVIASNYQDMLESEIGRCMHEERTLNQRQQYRGSLSRNVVWLLDYMFTSCKSPKINGEDLPIKLWAKYMPDYVDRITRELFDIPTGLTSFLIH